MGGAALRGAAKIIFALPYFDPQGGDPERSHTTITREATNRDGMANRRLDGREDVQPRRTARAGGLPSLGHELIMAPVLETHPWRQRHRGRREGGDGKKKRLRSRADRYQDRVNACAELLAM